MCLLEKVYERLKYFKIGERVESDHLPLEMEIEIETKNEERRLSRKKEDKKKGEDEEKTVIC